MDHVRTHGAAHLGAAADTARAAAAAPRPWRTVVAVFKLRIGVLIMVTALGGLAAVPGGAATALQVVALAVSVLLASASAGAFNQFVEADGDRLMARTRRRPFASGALRRSPGWLLAIVALFCFAVAGASWLVNPLAAFFVALGALTYAVVYTLWLKRRTAWNIVIGGLSGSFAVLAGAATAAPQIDPLAWILAFVLFLWTPSHFWSLAIAGASDYAAAGVPMLPVVVGNERAARIVHANTVILVAASLLPVVFGAGWVYLVAALGGGLHLLGRTRRLARAPSRQTAMAAFFASMVQLSVLLAGVVLDALLR